MAMAHDPDKFEAILSAPDQPVPLDFVLNSFWPRLGLLPMEPENPDLVLKIAEFMLNEIGSDSHEGIIHRRRRGRVRVGTNVARACRPAGANETLVEVARQAIEPI